MDLPHVIAFVLLDIAIVVVAARLGGRLARKIGQPAVVGEILAGIALGPTLLGALPGDLDQLLFPADVRPFLMVIAQIGLVLFMFIVGLELDSSLIRGRERAAGAIAAGTLVLPFALGTTIALLLYPLHNVVDGQTVPPLAFVLFIGIALSITALPVLARILTERGMQRTKVGVLALACAALNDVVGWSLLALVVAVAAGGDPAGAARIIGLTVAFVLVMFLVVRPLLARLVAWHRSVGRLTPDMLAVILAGLLLSAWATDVIGVHAIFGAFVFGAIMPRGGAAALTREILERLEQISLLLLLPVFFVVAGLQVDVGAVGLDGLWQLGLILFAAIAGKFLGAALVARSLRMPRRQATALGVLMNTRGLTEIVILTVGVQLGVLDPILFTLMVIMALVTTGMTGPLLRRVYPDRVVQRELAAAERAELGEVDAFTVLTLMPDGADAAQRTARLAQQLTGRERPSRVVLCQLLPAQPQLEVASGLGAELALITGAGEELRKLASELEAAGTPTSVVARFSADPAADLAALVHTLDADILLLVEADRPTTAGSTDGTSAPEPSKVEALGSSFDAVPEVTVVIARLRGAALAPGETPVGVLADGGPGGRAALRMAAYLALRVGSVLAVGGANGRRAGRRGASAVETLLRAGLSAAAVDPTELADSAVLVLPAGTVPPAEVGDEVTVLHVRPSAADTDEDLTQVVARVALGQGD